MKLLKIFFNSLLGGVFFSSLMALLILDLNINQAFSFGFFSQVLFFLLLTYGFLLTILFMLGFFVVQYFLGRKIRISLISPSFLIVIFSICTGLFILVSRANYRYFRSFFLPEIKEFFLSQTSTLIFLLVVGILVYTLYYRYKKSSLFFIVYFLLLAGCLGRFVIKRTVEEEPQKAEKYASLEAKEIEKGITIIGLEGLSFDFVIPLISEGKLPNFSLLMEKGSWGKLETFTPNEPIVLNNSFNTGKLPAKHKQISLHKYRFFSFSTELEVVPRFILFRQMTRSSLIRMREEIPVPVAKDIWMIFDENKTNYVKMDWPYSFQVSKPKQNTETRFKLLYPNLQHEISELFQFVSQSYFNDWEYEEAAMDLKKKNQPRLFYVLLNGLNTVESLFYRYSFPEMFGELDQEKISKYKSVIEKYYQYYDQVVGKYIASLRGDELLMVFSPHGIEPLPLWKRFVERVMGNEYVSAYHEHAPEGVIFFFGNEVDKGKNIEGMRLIDVAPTLLYYVGLPVGRDMDGIAQRAILFIEEFTNENPVFLISSYEDIVIKKPE
ncbi:MAG: alkaline phosphatase family protein [Candidatus Aminicenantes bacterium]|nr:alkaline phosphatase family protein [Candidatus Aminicenantes bacterium]